MTSTGDRPNILFLFTDQQRLDSLGCYGNLVVRTPHIDRIATAGVRFNQAYTCTAICTAARASVLTGVMPHKHGLLANFERNVGYPTELPEGTLSFADYLREAGYEVGTVGKWHVGIERGPDYYGFDGVHYPGWGQPVEHEDYRAYLDAHGYPHFKVRDAVSAVCPNPNRSIPIAGIHEGPVEASFPYFLAERTIERLRRYAEGEKQGTPFFLACQWFGPHLPYFIPEEYYNMYDPDLVQFPAGWNEMFTGKPRVHQHYAEHWGAAGFRDEMWRKLIAVYWGFVTLIDEQVGRILAELEALGLTDRTALFFSSDHGAFVGSHGMQDKGPAMYDDIYRIPMVARMPGGVRGRVDARFVSLVDLPATFLDLAGVELPTHFDGSSFAPLLRGEADLRWREHITAEFHGHHFPYPQRMIRTERYKLVVNPPDINELYDLEADPGELANRIDDEAYQAVKKELMSLLYRELRARGDNFFHWMTTKFDIGDSDDDPLMR